MERNIITIDQEKCTGCGLCIPNCPEGAIQIIDNKARLISDLFCDGLGACLGHCPESAISIERREAEPYDERKVMENIVKQGANVIVAHLKHLKEHGETALLQTALDYLREKNITVDLNSNEHEDHDHFGGCPGSRPRQFAKHGTTLEKVESSKRESQLTHWPIQLHLISPAAEHYKGADLLLAADCVAYSLSDFHQDYLIGHKLAIGCPKLDENQEIYEKKITALIDEAKVNTITVMIMQVPCCSGLMRLAKNAAEKAHRKVPIKSIVVGLEGEV